jgi:hypothetical protein
MEKKNKRNRIDSIMGAFSSTPSMLSGEQFIEAIRRGSVIEVEDYLSQGGIYMTVLMSVILTCFYLRKC